MTGYQLFQGQALFVRAIGAFIILGLTIAKQGVDTLTKVERLGLQVLPIVLATADTGFSMPWPPLPLTDAMIFYMAGPIYIAALYHFFLSEKVGWRRWITIVLDFCSVTIRTMPVHRFTVLAFAVCHRRQSVLCSHVDP